MNFVLDDVLDGGVNDALNLDSHGKALSFLLLDLPLDVPAALLPLLRGPDSHEPLRRQAMTDPTRRSCVAPCSRCRRAGAGAPGRRAIPAKPITFIVPFAAGSATDQLARALGQSITESTKQAVVVDNKAGASGMLAAQAAARARGRRLHGADHHQHHARGQRTPVQEAAVRPGEGLRAGHRPRQGRPGAGGGGRLAVQDASTDLLDFATQEPGQAHASAAAVRAAAWPVNCSSR